MDLKTEVVIVNWNSGEQLHDCIQSLIDTNSRNISKIIVVDNGSTDGSESFVEAYPTVRLIRARQNLGFAKACNLGAQHCQEEFMLFLNPDTKVYSNTLSACTTFMQNPENFQVGICGVRLLDEDNNVTPSCSRFPHLTRFISQILGIDRFSPRLGHLMREWPHDLSRPVDQVMGAFFLVRKSLFDKLEGFDERFFVYYEEVDFCYRAYKAGWISVYITDAQAFHAGGGTSRQVKAKRLFYSLRSRILYAFKHFSKWQAWALLLLTCLVEPFTRTVFCLLKRDWSGIKNTFSGYRMLYAALPEIITHRDKSA